MVKNAPVSALISIGFGVLILLAPWTLSYAIAIYLIIAGVMMIDKKK
jgi:hypothetical protein